MAKVGQLAVGAISVAWEKSAKILCVRPLERTCRAGFRESMLGALCDQSANIAQLFGLATACRFLSRMVTAKPEREREGSCSLCVIQCLLKVRETPSS